MIWKTLVAILILSAPVRAQVLPFDILDNVAIQEDLEWLANQIKQNKVAVQSIDVTTSAVPTGPAGGNLNGFYPDPGIASLPAISGAPLTNLTGPNVVGAVPLAIVASSNVLKSGDTMTGQLTINGSSLTVIQPSTSALYMMAVTSSAIGGTYALLVSTKGNVGIGTGDPDAMLDIRGSTGTESAGLSVSNIRFAAERSSFVATVSANPWIYNAAQFPLSGGGDYPFDSYGEMIFQGGTRLATLPDYNGGFAWVTGQATLGSKPKPTVKMRLTVGGNVGINTGIAAPVTTLEVIGGIRGSTITGVMQSPIPPAMVDLSTVASAISLKVAKAGDTMTGLLTVSSDTLVSGQSDLGGVGGVAIRDVGANGTGTIGFNSRGNASTTYAAGVAGYGGLLQMTAATGLLTYYAESNVAADSAHSHTTAWVTDNAGNFGIKNAVPTTALTVYGVITSSTTQPTIACSAGTGVIGVNATNQHGKFVAGAASANCTLTFSTAYPKAPSCWCNDESAIVVVQAISTTTTLKCSVAVTMGGDTINYGCMGAP